LLLADLGADVIKVESRLGDLLRQVPPKVQRRSAYFLSINRNKRSLGINLKKPAGRELFLDLARHSDVVLEGFRPGRVRRLGIDPETVLAANPAIVYCQLSGYGQDGPDAKRAGHDLTYLARSGVLALNAGPDGTPVLPPVQMADLSAGTTASLAICAALFDRTRTGRGRVLDISIFESIAPWMSFHLEAHRAGASVERGGMPLSGRYPFYNVYRTADGGHVALAALEPLFWRDFCRAVGRADLAGRQFVEGAERQELFAQLRDLFASRSTEEWRELFHSEDLSAEVLSDLDGVLADPQLRARGSLLVLHHPEEGDLVQVGSPIRDRAEGDEAIGLPPDLAADTRPILSEVLDLGDAEIDNLFASRVVFGPDEATPKRIAPESLP
jgi:crotonobetainyl-CoA:carnitine CoA-transferase CaiB-like acyl-CoA transferase